MELREIIGKFKNLRIYEERFFADNYYEVVFYTKDNDRWFKLFTELLGPAIKPAGVAPSEEDIMLTKKYGGIRVNQTLFKGVMGNTTAVAMFWPWQDEVRTTLKIAFVAR